MNLIFVIIFLPVLLFSHPLDNLTSGEITQFHRLVSESKKFSPEARYSILSIDEPSKTDYREGKARRVLFGSLYEPKENMLYHVRIDPDKNKILKIEKVPGVQPPISNEDFERLSRIVKADSRWQDAVRKRGFQDFTELYIDGWAPGTIRESEKQGNYRLMRGLTYYRGKGINIYARPVEGILVTVDLITEKVISFRDVENTPVPRKLNELSGKKSAPSVSNPVSSIQKGGSNIMMDGQKIQWFNWEFRWNFDPVHALQIYDASFIDNGKKRSVLYKLSLSEMVVPYGDTNENWAFRNAFDVGEYGLGASSHSLRKGIEVPPHAQLFDIVYSDESGKPNRIQNAVAVYERSQGILWTHLNQDIKVGHKDTLKSQELVMTFLTAVGNYDYGLSYIFHMDGTIEVQVLLTGILLAKGSPLVGVPCENECNPIVEKFILAPPHQHFFNFRIDLDVDSYTRNTPVEINTQPILDKSINPEMNGFEKVNIFINSENEGMRNMDLSKSRMWKIQSTNNKNSMKHPTGYMLMPGENSIPYLQEGSPVLDRAKFIKHHVWFTKYKDTEQCAAGNYPNQSEGGKGLPEFVSDNESLEDTDIVMWYTMGITHHPRPEEWPIMSAHKAGFKLVPVHFFNRNPTAP